MDQTVTDQMVQDDTEIAATDPIARDDAEIADDLLIEEISIDGMCGVY